MNDYVVFTPFDDYHEGRQGLMKSLLHRVTIMMQI